MDYKSGHERLQIRAAFGIINLAEMVTNWVTDYKSGQMDYKLGQGLQIGPNGLQIGPVITNWCRTHLSRIKNVHF